MSARHFTAASITRQQLIIPPNQERRQRPREIASFKNAILGFTAVRFSAEAKTLQKRHQTAPMEIFEQRVIRLAPAVAPGGRDPDSATRRGHFEVAIRPRALHPHLGRRCPLPPQPGRRDVAWQLC